VGRAVTDNWAELDDGGEEKGGHLTNGRKNGGEGLHGKRSTEPATLWEKLGCTACLKVRR